MNQDNFKNNKSLFRSTIHGAPNNILQFRQPSATSTVKDNPPKYLTEFYVFDEESKTNRIHSEVITAENADTAEFIAMSEFNMLCPVAVINRR